jgi:hypothetical protein
MIQLNEQQVKDLLVYIGKIPTDFGLPLVQFFNQLNAEQNPQAPQEEVKED